MVWDDVDIESLLPQEKAYSVVRLNTRKPPGHDDAAVKRYEVDDLGDANTPALPEVVWMAYDRQGNTQVIE